jgi:hypothetical protein
MTRAILFPLLLVSVGAVWATNITEAVEYTSTSTLNDSRPYTLGYEFITTTTLDINALGYWVDGNSNNHQVGLWTSTGTLLASTTVLSTDPIVGNFQYDSIADVILAPGDYIIGGEFLGNNDPFPYDALGVTTIPGFTWVTDWQIQSAGLNFPTDTTGGSYGANGILLANFSVNTGAIPEPVTLALTAAGLAGLGLLRKIRARV